jgi:14-3-3 protein epsilon
MKLLVLRVMTIFLMVLRNPLNGEIHCVAMIARMTRIGFSMCLKKSNFFSLRSMADERELLLYYLRVLYSTENRVERMEEQEENIRSVKRIVSLNPVLQPDERLILSLAYKNAVASRRNAMHDVQTLLQQTGLNPRRHRRLQDFLETLQRELREICLDLINLIDTSLAPASCMPEQRVFYEKMKGDYYRYICENKDEEFAQYAAKAKDSYETAMEIAKNEFPCTSPHYLGLVLNFSVFLYEIMELPDEAIEVSQRAFTDAVDQVDNLDDSPYQDITVTLHILRDNHSRWIQFREQRQ